MSASNPPLDTREDEGIRDGTTACPTLDDTDAAFHGSKQVVCPSKFLMSLGVKQSSVMQGLHGLPDVRSKERWVGWSINEEKVLDYELDVNLTPGSFFQVPWIA